MTVLTPFQRLARLAASAVLAVVLVLSAAMPSLSSAQATTPATAGLEVKSDTAPLHDEAGAACLFCGSTICSGLDSLLGGTSSDVAVVPCDAPPVLRDRTVRLPPPRAPPAHATRHLVAFDPRGPPPAAG